MEQQNKNMENLTTKPSNLEQHRDCPFRNQLGNCLPVGGFCTSVNRNICRAMHYTYSRGYKDAYEKYREPNRYIGVLAGEERRPK